MDTVTLYSTWPTLDSAEAAARALLEERQIACANIVPGVRSVFRWEGQIQVEAEVSMFAKTSADRAAGARDLLLRLHPYETPCLTAFPIMAEASNSAFLNWVAAETASLPE
jgi:periplasmic divalent cation tolerance protein